MKPPLFFLTVLTAVNANSFTMKTRRSGSLRAKLKATGQYQQYLESVNAYRTHSFKSASQPFKDYVDEFYLGDIEMTVVLDTGSSNLWVIDEDCTADGCEAPEGGFVKRKFDTRNSSTFTKEEHAFTLLYGSGYCFGYLGTDTLSFAGLSVESQEFGVATIVAKVFAYQPVDGIFGLGWPDLAQEQVVPPMQNVLPQLDKPIFTVWMDRKLKPAMGEEGGLITFGDLDKVNCAPTVSYVNLSSLTYWQFPIDGFSFGPYSLKKSEQAISDTGTSWIGGPDGAIQMIARITGAFYDIRNQMYIVHCYTMRALPDLVFTINSIEYRIPSIEYVLDIGLDDGLVSSFQTSGYVFHALG
ncbi:unnamed protein product [Heligmosomoides polygyrus]|uniref:Peptidase A1 domain-containing protein n=1 Tax=Heligmosomoides polygyrus TaxID=6339 RepID=A0A183GGQ1_HELPZ|nr:unnamed protein product [Heligmosomoides polygyrus]